MQKGLVTEDGSVLLYLYSCKQIFCYNNCVGVFSNFQKTLLSYILTDPIVCVACGKAASDTHDSNKDDFYNWINFLFVKKDYQVFHSKTFH